MNVSQYPSLSQEEACSQEELDTVLNLDARDWEAQQEENQFWHTTLIVAYSSRYYRLVSLTRLSDVLLMPTMTKARRKRQACICDTH